VNTPKSNLDLPKKAVLKIINKKKRRGAKKTQKPIIFERGKKFLTPYTGESARKKVGACSAGLESEKKNVWMGGEG